MSRETYSSGQSAVQLNDDGSGFVYYLSSGGSDSLPVAACVSSVSEYQHSFLFYDKPTGPAGGATTHGGLPKSKLLCSIDALATGFAQSNVGPHPCTVPGVTCPNFVPASGKLGLCRTCSKTVGEHAAGAKLILNKQGGIYSDESGRVVKRWLWDVKKQGAGTPPSEPIQFPLNAHLTFQYKDRSDITVTFTCEGVRHEFQCGQVLRRTDSYLDKVVGTCIGEFRGKKVLNVSTPSLLQRHDDTVRALQSSASTGTLRTTELVDSFGTLSKTCGELKSSASGVTLATTWKSEALNRTMTEAPQFNRVSSADTLRSSALLSTAGGSSFGGTGTLPTEGYGSSAGVGNHKGKWLNELDVHNKLKDVHPVLKRSTQLKAASGRYTIDVPVETKDGAFRKLRCVTSSQLEAIVSGASGEVKPSQLVFVACVREDDPHCRRAMQVLEQVNGTLATEFPSSPQYATDDTDAVSSSPPSGSTNQTSTGSGECPYWLLKYDVAESRYMVKKYNVHTLPCFLAYQNGKLVYAGVLGGAGKVRLPACVRPVNYLLLEPDASSQIQIERVLKMEGAVWDLAVGTYDAGSGGFVDVVPDGIANINRLVESSRRRSAPSGPLRGLDTTPEVVDCYSAVIVNSTLPPVALAELTRTLLRSVPVSSGSDAKSGDGSSGSGVTFPGSSARLCGGSIVMALHPTGTALPGHVICPVCTAIARDGFGKHPETVAQQTVNEMPPVSMPWVCPRCMIIQNIESSQQSQLLLGTVCSVAAVRPLKAGTFSALSFLWRQLRAKQTHFTTSAGTSGILGLTDATLRHKLREFLDKGTRGDYLPSSFRFEDVVIPAQDTHVRGLKLTGKFEMDHDHLSRPRKATTYEDVPVRVVNDRPAGKATIPGHSEIQTVSHLTGLLQVSTPKLQYASRTAIDFAPKQVVSDIPQKNGVVYAPSDPPYVPLRHQRNLLIEGTNASGPNRFESVTHTAGKLATADLKPSAQQSAHGGTQQVHSARSGPVVVPPPQVPLKHRDQVRDLLVHHTGLPMEPRRIHSATEAMKVVQQAKASAQTQQQSTVRHNEAITPPAAGTRQSHPAGYRVPYRDASVGPRRGKAVPVGPVAAYRHSRTDPFFVTDPDPQPVLPSRRNPTHDARMDASDYSSVDYRSDARTEASDIATPTVLQSHTTEDNRREPQCPVHSQQQHTDVDSDPVVPQLHLDTMKQDGTPDDEPSTPRGRSHSHSHITPSKGTGTKSLVKELTSNRKQQIYGKQSPAASKTGTPSSATSVSSYGSSSRRKPVIGAVSVQKGVRYVSTALESDVLNVHPRYPPPTGMRRPVISEHRASFRA